MKLGYDLTIEQSQKLVMTPELIQAIKILQLNTQELETYIEEQLLTNPVLEEDESTDEETAEKVTEDEEFDWSEYLQEREYDDISYRQHEYSAKEDYSDEYSYEQFTPNEVTLTEHLMFQLQFAEISQKRKQIGKYIIESLDDNGYMTQSVMDIAAFLNAPDKKVEEVLKVIQGFDPIGVAAKDLKECLLIQMEAMGECTEDVQAIIENHLEELASNKLAFIAKQVGISTLEVQEIGDLIKLLEPKPGRQFASAKNNTYIIPDVVVDKVGDEYIVTVNDTGAPRLRVSSYYQRILKEESKGSNISQFLNDRLNSAVWLIKSIEQRRQTIYNVVSAIVNYQKDFFEYGSKHLKPLTLKHIADEVGIHESTVSRSVGGKYMQSPRGVFEIKYFFTSGVADGTQEGIASGSIKEMIKELIDGEKESSPMSDQKIADTLKKENIDISRRTVAKYRDEMGIQSSSKRKRY